jgi:glycosyltransferase involved in cell wall biosynthesis
MAEISALLRLATGLASCLCARHSSTPDLGPSRFEIIAVDDGSTTILQLCCAATPLADTKNLAIFAARSPIVIFLDDDDVTLLISSRCIWPSTRPSEQ